MRISGRVVSDRLHFWKWDFFLSWSCGPPNMFDVSYQKWMGFGAQMGVVEVDLVAEEACIPSSYL